MLRHRMQLVDGCDLAEAMAALEAACRRSRMSSEQREEVLAAVRSVVEPLHRQGSAVAATGGQFSGSKRLESSEYRIDISASYGMPRAGLLSAVRRRWGGR